MKQTFKRSLQGNVIVIIIIILVIVITAGMIGRLVTKQIQAPVAKNTTVQANSNGSTKNILSDWKTYRSQEEYGFKFKYPKDWLIREYDTPNGEDGIFMHVMAIGDPASFSVQGGDGRWLVEVYKSVGDANNLIDKYIAVAGSQFGNAPFNDRKEKRENVVIGGKQVIKATVTTASEKDWVLEQYFFVENNNLLVVGNGSVKDDLFDLFISSFEFTR